MDQKVAGFLLVCIGALLITGGLIETVWLFANVAGYPQATTNLSASELAIAIPFDLLLTAAGITLALIGANRCKN
jgi:hypothetical protein